MKKPRTSCLQGRRHAPSLALFAAVLAPVLFAGCGKTNPSALKVEEAAAAQSVRRLVVSVVDKPARADRAALADGITTRASHPFFLRWATPGSHIYVANSSMAGARRSFAVEVAAEQDLALVEGQSLSPTLLPGEVFRSGDVAVILLAKGQDPHALLGTHQHFVERVGTALIEASVSAEAEQSRLLATPLTQPVTRPADLAPSDAGWLKEKVRELSGDVPVTINGRLLRLSDRGSASGRADARTWLRHQYEQLGYTVTEVPYRDGMSAGSNLVATRAADAPRSDGFVIVSGHLDSVGNAGADDDAAGLVSALHVAHALADKPLRRELRMVAFDQEEDGLVGSAAYARQLRDSQQIDRLVGVFQVEMPTYDSNDDGHYHIIDCRENRSAELSQAVAAGGKEIGLTRVDACTNRSDHASFWRYNRPAVVLSQNFFGGDGNPCYHRSCDKFGADLNFGYMAKLTDALTQGVAATVLVEP